MSVLLAFTLGIPGRSQQNSQKAELAQLFQIGLPPADVGILLDASLSMKHHHYDDVRQAVVEFTSTLTNNEILSLRVFGDIAGAPLEDRADKIAGNVAGRLPKEPLFQYTDLGLAILKGLEFLERSGSSEAQTLFLITDGMHQPPPGSPYSRDFAGDRNWQALRERAQSLCQKRQVMIYGFGLGRQTDVALLRQVFPTTNVELIVGDAAQVVSALRRVRENLRQVQLRRAVEQELNGGTVGVQLDRSEIDGAADGFTQPVTIRNNYRHLPVIIERVELRRSTASSNEVVCELEGAPRELTLAPGQQWRGRLKGLLRAELPRIKLGRNERVYRAEIQITPIAKFQNHTAIAQLDPQGLFSPEPACAESSMRINLRARYGLPYWLVLVSLLFCSVLILAIRQRRKLMAKHQATIEGRHAERRRISGEIKIWPARVPEPDEGGADLSAYRSETLRLVKKPDGELDVIVVVDPDAETVATLSGHLSGANPAKAESGRIEFRLEAARGHRLAYECGDGWREAQRVVLCDRDLIEIDGWRRLRYANHRLRTRAEVESAYKE
jgi:hypothetical protein